MKPLYLVIGMVILLIIVLIFIWLWFDRAPDTVETGPSIEVPQTTVVSPVGTPTSSATVVSSNVNPIATFTPIPIATLEPTATVIGTDQATASPTSAANTVTKPELVWLSIPAGEFIMGSSDTDVAAAVQDCNLYEGNCQAGWFNGETPQKRVSTETYQLTQREITNAQYNLCVQFGPCSPPSRISSDGSVAAEARFFSDDFPVVTITQAQAAAFCNWLAGRLPTEQEWEKAARGNDGRRYPWGNDLDLTKANLQSNGPRAVGSYQNGASPYGLLDMAGNVAEFTSNNVVRGGSWKNPPHQGRTTQRSTGAWLTADFTNFDIGFRCAK